MGAQFTAPQKRCGRCPPWKSGQAR